MSDLKKTIKLPDTYDPVKMQKIVDSMIDGTQSKYLSSVTAIPNKTDGQNGEMRVDHSNSKVYVKINGAWKSITTT